MASGDFFKPSRAWQIATFILLIVCIALFIALIVVATKDDDDTNTSAQRYGDGNVSICGENLNPNGHFIDMSEPENPGPFHDLTIAELNKLRSYLENHPQIQAKNYPNLEESYIFLAELWLPPKKDVLKFLDEGGPQPPRRARAMVFRGDKNPPVVEEWICGPLPDPTSCELLIVPNRRNPVEFESRPLSGIELYFTFLGLPQIDQQIGHILEESYGAKFSGCVDPKDCLTFQPVPVGSNLTGEINRRRIWYWVLYQVPFPLNHPTDFGMLFNMKGSHPVDWSIEKVWYGGNLFNGLDDLVQKYDADTIPKTRMTKPVYSNELYSSLERRGDPLPPNPQRPPTQVEPDGKRYTLNQRKVEYMGWSFHFRTSPFSGPGLYDIRFKGERIAYELALSEFAAFYSGNSPLSQLTDYVDSGGVSGLGAKALVPGGDCPETATLISNTFLHQYLPETAVYDAAYCLFEYNNGYPLRRHLQYNKPIGYYGGMLDSVLILRTALTVGNYDYIVDFIFHQNGALETRLMSTGYIQTNIYREVERLYGFQIEEGILGNLHHHIFHLKADLDINGVSNRYETLDIEREDTTVTYDNSTAYSQTKFKTTLKESEQDALYSYNFDHPRYHIVHNDVERTKFNEKRGYRIHLSGMSKNLYREDQGNEPVISWARHQIAVTKQKDEEFRSSSTYGMYDSLDPVVDFSNFYADNETIVDEDLVFWLTLGLHHIPHTEDLPVTPTAGNHLTAFLLPYNYFPECPSMGSRDAIYISYKNQLDPSEGIQLDRNGNTRDTCMLPLPTLEEDIEENPDQVMESKRDAPSI